MTEYYQYRDVVVNFDVTKDGEDTTPQRALVSVFDPDKKDIKRDRAKVKGNEVSYNLKGKEVEKVGKYTFMFDVKITGFGVATHKVEAVTKKSPVPVKRKNANI